MRDINIDRLSIVIELLHKGKTLIDQQGMLGIEPTSESCCNRQMVKGKEIGCVVGLLVGVDEFDMGSQTTANRLEDRLVKKLFDGLIGPMPMECDFVLDLTQTQRGQFKAILSALQRIHDFAPRGGFKSADLFILLTESLFEHYYRVKNAHLGGYLTNETYEFSCSICRDPEALTKRVNEFTDAVNEFTAKQ